MHILSSNRRISRRQLLRGAGAALSLPFLEAMLPPFTSRLFAATPVEPKPQRMLAICNNLGVLPDHFFPEQAGRDYTLSSYLSELSSHKDDLTVLSGVSHPGVDGAHESDVSFLTGAPHPGGGGFRNTISLDQYIAGKLGHHTRFPSLTLGVNAAQGRRSLSWTPSGVLIPCEDSAANVYKQLFLQGSEKEIERQLKRLKLGESIMDTVAGQAHALNRRLGASDRDRMDQYTTAVRETERRMEKAREWERFPKPVPSADSPIDPGGPAAYMEKTRLMYEMARLAFETDSTRSIALLLDSNNSPTINVSEIQISDGYHNLSHHGKDEQKLAQLEAIDRNHMRLIGELIGTFKEAKEGDANLLDNSLILYGSNLGDANKHTTDNMPMLVAGGRIKHGQHLAFDRDDNYPLPNLYVSMLQSMGIETDEFATSTGTMRGLDFG